MYKYEVSHILVLLMLSPAHRLFEVSSYHSDDSELILVSTLILAGTDPGTLQAADASFTSFSYGSPSGSCNESCGMNLEALGRFYPFFKSGESSFGCIDADL